MGNGGQGTDSRGFGGFGRRNMLRRGSGAESPSSGNSSTQLNALSLLAERPGASALRSETTGFVESGATMLAPPPRGSSRRNRIEDLEDMMMMEAIRLSLASEEERKKKEDKEAKKEAKKKGKEMKKAEKAARKRVVYSNSANPSSLGLDGIVASLLEESPSAQDKGKGIDRSTNGTPLVPPSSKKDTSATVTSTSAPAAGNLQNYLDQIRAQLQTTDDYTLASPSGCEPQKPSHLRQISNASSSASSYVESVPGSLKNGLAGSSSSLEASPNASGLHIPPRDTVSNVPGSATPGGGAGTEPMFNFRSLAAMIDDEEKDDTSVHIENIRHQGDIPSENGTGHSPNHKSSEVIHGSNSISLEQSTVTLQAEGSLQGSSGNGSVDTPGVLVTSPSETSFHYQDKSISDSTGTEGILVSDSSEHPQRLPS